MILIKPLLLAFQRKVIYNHGSLSCYYSVLLLLESEKDKDSEKEEFHSGVSDGMFVL